MLPYDSEVLYAVLAQYNRAVWPAVLIAYALGLGLVALALRPHPWGGRVAGLAPAARVTGIALAAFWAWVGAAWHLIHFAPINFAAPLYGGLFIAQAALFAWTGAVRGRLGLRFRADARGWMGLGLAASGLIAYPVIFLALGDGWQGTPLVGLAPVPTTLFTLGILLLIEGRSLWHLLAVPVLWSLIDGATAWVLGMHEDLVLPAAGIVTAGLVGWRRWRQIGKGHEGRDRYKRGATGQ